MSWLDHVITARDILVVSAVSVVVILTLFAIGTAIARKVRLNG